jgi:serine/threonine protein kinase
MPVRLVSQEEPLPGYRLVERLGRGGFGEVWKVEAPGGLLKAMKFVFGDLDSADEEGKPAEQELKALNRVKSIRHPYILSLERFDIVDGQLIIVMELADRNLWDRFRECRAMGLPGIPREELLRYMEESAEALDLMNNQYQIQHLDIKPQNLFLIHNHVKVADFGLAKDFEGARGTMTGGVTPVYAAPETFEGYLSRYTDQYSLAIVFQELLTGTRPFTGANTKQLLMQHLNSPPDLSALPDSDRPVLERALAKIPDQRWPSCSEMVQALRQAGMTEQPRRNDPELSTTTRVATPQLLMARGGSLPLPQPSPAVSPRPPTSPFPGPSRPAPSNTPLPSLVTPKLVTPQTASSGGPAPAITLQRPAVFQTGRMKTLGIAPPEKTGSGVLFPALLIGIGQTGLSLLFSLRRLIRERYGRSDVLANLRFLFIDTDPETTSAASQGPDALRPAEIITARLNRPAHYLQREGLPPVEPWLPPGLLYQLPKNPGPAAGVRPFGRLALCDNYRLIAQRIRQELETFLTDEPLERAGQATALGVRSNRPRAYLLAGLAGGTGSGMITDLAYVVRHELRSVGYRKPQTVGYFLVPPAEATSARTVGLANTFAALIELSYFGPEHRYVYRFDTTEAPISDPEPPFNRIGLLPLPRTNKERDQSRSFGNAAQSLFLELLTPAGPVLDQMRNTGTDGGFFAQVFGSYRFHWPRPQLLATAIRRFSQRLLQRWSSRETSHLREPITLWLAEQWHKRQLDPNSIRGRFEAAVKTALGEEPTSVFHNALELIRTNTPTGSRIDAATVCSVLDSLLKLVGKPGPESDLPGSLSEVVARTRQQLIAEAETNLSTIAVSFIEQPQYRLAGAEEALNMLGDRLRTTLEQLEATHEQRRREVAELLTRLLQQIGMLESGWKLGAMADLLELLRQFPQKKLECIYLDSMVAMYRTLFNNLPEYRQDVNFCRKRFSELAGQLSSEVTATAPASPGEMLLLAGCNNFDEAADQFLGQIPPEKILSFDQSLQQQVKQRFRGLVNVCLKPEYSGEFLNLLTDQARSFLDAEFPSSDPAAIFLEKYPEESAALAVLRKAYDAATPTMTPEPPAGEAVVVATPAGPAGERVRELAQQAFPELELLMAAETQDIIVYREYPRVSLPLLPAGGEIAREAYVSHADQPLHTRIDIPWSGS